MKNTINIISRSSALARIQAEMVGETIKKKYPHLTLNYLPTKTSGDVNQNIDISNSPDIGVFTKDISHKVANSKNSIAVHSWKDFPIEENHVTNIYGTLRRADMRDIIILKSELKNTYSINELIIMTSSPRRRYALELNLADLVPLKYNKIKFKDIRGNIETRLNKFINSDAHGIVVAKAAVDRILEYENTNGILNSLTQTCLQSNQWIVLPLSLFPSAPAQGAVGIEIANNNSLLIDLIRSINEGETFSDVSDERKIMSKYGGGCSQKIGVSIWNKNNLKIKSISGLTENSEILDKFEITQANKKDLKSIKAVSRSKVFPVGKKERDIFLKVHYNKNSQLNNIKDSIIYITKRTVLKQNPIFSNSCTLITSGMKTWKESVKKGYWINGTTDSLGQSELDDFTMISKNKRVTILSFKKNSKNNPNTIDLYELKNPIFPNNFENREEYFWMSAYAFTIAVALHPSIINKRHACGMGNTYIRLKKIIGEEGILTPYLSYQHWLNSLED